MLAVALVGVARGYSQALFRFGVIADVQYADIEDGPNHSRTRTRRYRQSLETLREASEAFADLDFCVALGDVVDTKASRLRWSALESVKEAMGNAGKWHVPPGNHDLSVFERSELRSLLANAPEDRLYYDWEPAVGWRCAVLDAYEISVVGGAGERRERGARLLASNNPNVDPAFPTKSSSETPRASWLDGLTDDNDFRWVPYNGGYGETQLKWFEWILRDADLKGQKLIVFSHPPVYREASRPNNCAWDFDRILRSIDRRPNVLALFFAGHDHDGGFAVRCPGEHHLTPPAPIECAEGEVAYGTVAVFPNHVDILWTGKTPVSPAHPWPTRLHFPRA
ncbi:hypothetical protein CTAYLR_006597 [Chrysophaeum taylorii]|uniref:Calcineurin-like phosphoesterase domain-containing protein n=1 Tax=Chrysophaeum taylorii TaxID=2483200 RepID=A0AAD7UPE9_9STRA|nr:hypothetical protein CTAYLR_006597 [Chrysophaeum taylorii]